jgi:hypothetical protein
MRSVAPQKPGKTEARLSLALMAILVIIAGGVIMRQFRFNPAVSALRPESRQHDLRATVDQAALVDIDGTGLAPFSPPERFGPDTLYEKIDGRADLYLSSGFVSLNTQRFTTDPRTAAWVEVYVYDMATAANAFSVYSMQRRQDARPDDIAPNAYRTKNALFMASGKFYLEIIGTLASPRQQKAVETLARLFVKAHGGKATARTPGAGLFPEAGLKKDSLQLIHANAFGDEKLDRVYTCDYRVGGVRLTAFVSDRRTAEAASALAGGYRKTLLSYGAANVDGPVPVDGAASLQVFDTYEIVFSRGRYLAGIHEAGDLNAAGRLARRLAAHLEGLTGVGH